MYIYIYIYILFNITRTSACVCVCVHVQPRASAYTIHSVFVRGCTNTARTVNCANIIKSTKHLTGNVELKESA